MSNYKNDFPILQQTIFGKPFIYLDSSASSQKPECVINAMSHYYRNDHANVHRGVYQLSQRATKCYEATRSKLQKFIHAKHVQEIIFTSGTTESINLVAQSYGRAHFKAGDEIILSIMEHHSNIVPWQLLAEQLGLQLKIIPILANDELDLAVYEDLFSERTKLVAVTHASNVLGTVNPIKKMASMAHQRAVPILVDGAQAFPHMPIDVQDLDCDFYVFSAHKAYGPTGIGVLYAKSSLLDRMPPYQGGGDMIEQVSFEKTTYKPLPYRFEAGTPNIAGVVGWGSAIDYLNDISMNAIMQHEQTLLQEATEKLRTIRGLKILGNAQQKVGVISFTLSDIHPHDIATILDHEGIAIRAGHHCAMPLLTHFSIPACVRVSFGLYNTSEDIDRLMEGLLVAERLFVHG